MDSSIFTTADKVAVVKFVTLINAYRIAVRFSLEGESKNEGWPENFANH